MAVHRVSIMQKSTHKLALTEKLGYGMGDAAANFVWRGLIFLPIFYTDVFGLTAAHAAILLLVIRLSDGVTDIIAGSIADRTNTKAGKYRPWILWSAPVLALLLVMIYYTPDFSYTGKLIYAYVVYFALTVAYTANNVPYGAMMGVMTDSVNERASLSSFRFIGAFGGGLLVMTTMPMLVNHFGQGNDAVGYQSTMPIFAVLLMIFMLITYATTKERISPPAPSDKTFWQETKELCYSMPVILIPVIGLSLFVISLSQADWSSQAKFFCAGVTLASFALTIWLRSILINRPRDLMNDAQKDLSDLLTNKPWLILLTVGVMFGLFTVIRPSAAGYYFKWYLGREDLLGYYFLITLLASLAAAIATNWLSQRFNKRTLMINAFVFGGIFSAAVYFVQPEQVMLMMVLATIGEFFAGMMPVLFFSMLGDTVDYSEWKNNRRATGLMYSSGTFINKTGHGFASALVLVVLAMYGYDPQIEATVTASINGMVSLMSTIPLGICVLGAIFVIWYPLNDSQMKQIESDLIQRRGGSIQ